MCHVRLRVRARAAPRTTLAERPRTPLNGFEDGGNFRLNTFREFARMLCAIVVLAVAHSGQASCENTEATGSLQLRVADADIDLPVIGCLASLTPRSSGTPMLCYSDVRGIADFKKILPGLYRLRVSCVRYFPEFIDSLMIEEDSTVTISIQLHPYNGLTEYDAYDDLARGIVRIYRDEWFLGPGADISTKYGFRFALKCCDPDFKFDRYNAVVYQYLDSLNGRGWYDRYLRDLSAATAASDSIKKRLSK